MDASKCNIPWFVVSACVLHNIYEAKGKPLPKSLPLQIELEWPLAPAGIVPANSQMEVSCLALHVWDKLPDHFCSLWTEGDES